MGLSYGFYFVPVIADIPVFIWLRFYCHKIEDCARARRARSAIQIL